MIFDVHVAEMAWLTLVVRAETEDRARLIAHEAASVYRGGSLTLELEELDPAGPEGVLVEDAS